MRARRPAAISASSTGACIFSMFPTAARILRPRRPRHSGAGRRGKPGDHNHERWSYGLPAPRFARPRNAEYAITQIGGPEARMVPFFVQIKCQLGKSYDVANKLADAEIASEIYSTAGDFDLLVKFYVDPSTDIGHFIAEKVQTIPGVADTRTIITFKAFGAECRRRCRQAV